MGVGLDILFICCGLQGSAVRLATSLRRQLAANGNRLPAGEWNSISRGLYGKERFTGLDKQKLAGTQCGVSGQFVYSARPSL